MNLSDRLAEDMKQAMKDKDKVRLSVIRMVRSAVKNREIDLGTALSDEEIVVVIQKELKQRKDSLQAFESAGRTDLISDVQAEISILSNYLPEQMSEKDLRQLAVKVIQELGAVGKSDMGKVMGKMMPVTRGKADGKLVQQVVESLLS